MRTVLVAAVVGLGLVGGVALGQQGDRVMLTSSVSASGPGGDRALSRETVDRMAHELGLDELQREIAMEMFAGVTDERQTLADVMRQEIERARELSAEGDMSAMIGRIKEATAAFQREARALEDTYMQDLRALLTAQQEAAWPQAERIRRRSQQLPVLSRSLARVDLEDLVREQFGEALADAEVADVLERWAVRVDGLLVERMRKADDIGGGPGFQGGVLIIDGEDPYEPLRAIDGRIVSASEQAVRTLAGVLEHDGIEQAWVRRAFARVYRQTDAERRLEAARALESLSEEQAEQLLAVAEQHAREADAARDRWVTAEKDREANNTLPMGIVIVMEGQEPTPSEVARDAVTELGRRLEAKLETILDASQLAELPESAGSAGEVAPAMEGGRSIRIGG